MNYVKQEYKYKSALLIDDNELDLFISSTLLRLFKFSPKIETNTSAEQVLDALKSETKKSLSTNESLPEVIFVDLNMPKMNGFEFLEAFHKLFAEASKKPITVVLSSSMNQKDKMKVSEISDKILFIEKPLTKESIDLIYSNHKA